MRKNIFLITLVLISVFGCKPEFDELTYTGGTADFTTYVAVGNSLTAGYADGALYISGQEYSYPAQLAKQMRLTGTKTEFTQPLMASETGGVTYGGNTIEESKFILGTSNDCEGVAGVGPMRIVGTPGTAVEDNVNFDQGPFHNFGVPGSKVIHLDVAGYGDIANIPLGLSNPYFVRMASTSSATMLDDAMASEPTFFSLWIGNNDVLGYATSGGVEAITPISNFNAAYANAIAKLTSTGAKGVIANIPDVTSIPYFTTMPSDPIALDNSSAINLTNAFARIADSISKTYGAGKGDMYKIQYVEGPNLFLIKVDINTDVTSSAFNPLGWRQIMDGEIALLSISQDDIKCKGYGVFDADGYNPFSDPVSAVIARVNPLMNQHVLTLDEVKNIESATASFNATIEAAAISNNLALADMHSKMKELKNSGLIFNDVTYTADFVSGGAFSFDGVHPTKRGYAIIANYFIDAINKTYTANLAKLNVNSIPGTVLP